MTETTDAWTTCRMFLCDRLTRCEYNPCRSRRSFLTAEPSALMPALDHIAPLRATITACWDTLTQARAHIAGETPDEPDMDNGAAVLEMIDEAIEDCRRSLS